MKVANFQGKSVIPSRAIRWITRADYSHSAFVFDEKSEETALTLIRNGRPFNRIKCFTLGSVVEAWQGGVQNPPNVSALHSPMTRVDLFNFDPPLTDSQESRLLVLLDGVIGDPYSYWKVLRFLTRRPAHEDDSWFCSELVAQLSEEVSAALFNPRFCAAWEVPPGRVPWSRRLAFDKTLYTSF